jgi:hypothetical protein
VRAKDRKKRVLKYRSGVRSEMATWLAKRKGAMLGVSEPEAVFTVVARLVDPTSPVASISRLEVSSEERISARCFRNDSSVRWDRKEDSVGLVAAADFKALVLVTYTDQSKQLLGLDKLISLTYE